MMSKSLISSASIAIMCLATASGGCGDDESSTATGGSGGATSSGGSGAVGGGSSSGGSGGGTDISDIPSTIAGCELPTSCQPQYAHASQGTETACSDAAEVAAADNSEAAFLQFGNAPGPGPGPISVTNVFLDGAGIAIRETASRTCMLTGGQDLPCTAWEFQAIEQCDLVSAGTPPEATYENCAPFAGTFDCVAAQTAVATP